MDDKGARPDALFVSPTDAEKIAPLVTQASGQLTLEYLDRFIDSVRYAWYGLVPDPAEFKRRYCPDSTFLDE